MAWRCALKVEEFSRLRRLDALLSAHLLGMAPILLSGQILLMWRTLVPAAKATCAASRICLPFAITELGPALDAEDGHGAAANQPGLRPPSPRWLAAQWPNHHSSAAATWPSS